MIKELLFFSFLLHITILQIKIPPPEVTPPKPKPKKISFKLKPKPDKKPQKKKGGEKDQDIFIDNLLKQLAEMEKIAKEEAVRQSKMRKCDTHYRGIGVTTIWDEIVKVAVGGPADKAGIKVGDRAVSDMNIRNKYAIGTKITVSVLRDGIIHHIPVTIGKICTHENKKP